MKFVCKEAQNLNIAAAILNSTQQPDHVSMTLFHPRDFVQIASEEPFNYHSGLWLLLSHAPNCEMMVLEIMTWIAPWKK